MMIVSIRCKVSALFPYCKDKIGFSPIFVCFHICFSMCNSSMYF